MEMYVGSAKFNADNIMYTLPDGGIVNIAIDPHTSLLIITNFVCSSEKQEIHGTWFENSMASYASTGVGFHQQQ